MLAHQFCHGLALLCFAQNRQDLRLGVSFLHGSGYFVLPQISLYATPASGGQIMAPCVIPKVLNISTQKEHMG